MRWYTAARWNRATRASLSRRYSCGKGGGRTTPHGKLIPPLVVSNITRQPRLSLFGEGTRRVKLLQRSNPRSEAGLQPTVLPKSKHAKASSGFTELNPCREREEAAECTGLDSSRNLINVPLRRGLNSCMTALIV